MAEVEHDAWSLNTEGQGRPDYRVVFRLDEHGQYGQLEVLIGPRPSQTKERLDGQIEHFATMLGPIMDGLKSLQIKLLKKPKFEPSFAPFEKLAKGCQTLDEVKLPRTAHQEGKGG
jgi:hypothetical protein